ncbi:MAG: hypothetical protein SPJ68_02870 [Arcanobacterium sp.]|nr:hypothetical protein [Arcanobacterium sp.]
MSQEHEWVDELADFDEAPPIEDAVSEILQDPSPPPVVTAPPLPKVKTTVMDIATEVLDALTTPEN